MTDRIRPAATVILWRDSGVGRQVLMGQRGAAAAFMPSKYVFPGGAVEAADTLAARRPILHPGLNPDPHPDPHPGLRLAPACRARLLQHCSPDIYIPETPIPDTPIPDTSLPDTLVAAALRELNEETGLIPAAHATLRFVFRAITPPGRPRRFDARFFLLNAAGVQGDTVTFSEAEDELSHLHWIGLSDARALDLPFITEVVLAEVTALLSGDDQPGVPFFDNSGPIPIFRRLL